MSPPPEPGGPPHRGEPPEPGGSSDAGAPSDLGGSFESSEPSEPGRSFEAGAPSEPGRSFEAGEGSWRGSAEVYDGRGRFLGGGCDARAVRRWRDDQTVEVEVSFTGPFRMSGRYVIADRGDHRLYQGPLNYGRAEAFGEGLVDANNYWPDLGFSQRLFLMVLPGGEAQLSLALLSRGERAVYAVVGEYGRGPGAAPAVVTGSAHDLSEDPRAGRPVSLLERPGTWSGTLSVTGPDGSEAGAAEYAERVNPAETVSGERGLAVSGERGLAVSVTGSGFAADAAATFATDGWHHWTGAGPVVGSLSLWGGRALSGNLLFDGGRLRLWRREVARSDGTGKAVLHTWYRGGSRVGVAYGVLDFAPG